MKIFIILECVLWIWISCVCLVLKWIGLFLFFPCGQNSWNQTKLLFNFFFSLKNHQRSSWAYWCIVKQFCKIIPTQHFWINVLIGLLLFQLFDLVLFQLCYSNAYRPHTLIFNKLIKISITEKKFRSPKKKLPENMLHHSLIQLIVKC